MTTGLQIQRLVAVGVTALVLGALDSLIKGDGTGLVGALSQTAAPWFLLAFSRAGAATSDRRIVLSVVAGFGATILALDRLLLCEQPHLSIWLGIVAGVVFIIRWAVGKIYFELALLSVGHSARSERGGRNTSRWLPWICVGPALFSGSAGSSDPRKKSSPSMAIWWLP